MYGTDSNPNAMSLGPVMLDLQGTTPGAEEIERLLHPGAGGVILFRRNYESPEQLSALVASIHRLREPRLLVAVDHEGGRVQRFRDGFTVLPAARRLGEVYDLDRKRGLHLAELAGWVMAAELRSAGVDFSFAPVLDLDHGMSQVIGDRAFHQRPEYVAALAHAYVSGIRRAGMAAVGKHFPGHGAVVVDSHVGIPVDKRSLADIRLQDLVPFERLIHYGLAGIMPSHVIYPGVDELPAGFSRRWLRGVLRQELGFQGPIFSDDISMKGAAAAGGLEERAHLALRAGCDMILLCNDPEGAAWVLDGMSSHPDPASHLRLARMHGRHRISRAELRGEPSWHQAVHALGQLCGGETPRLI